MLKEIKDPGSTQIIYIFTQELSVISVADDSPDFIHNLLENILWNVPRTIDKPEILNEFWARSSWNYDMACNQRYQWEMSPLKRWCFFLESLIHFPNSPRVLNTWKKTLNLRMTQRIFSK